MTPELDRSFPSAGTRPTELSRSIRRSAWWSTTRWPRSATTSRRSACRRTRARTWTCRSTSTTTARRWIRCRWSGFTGRPCWWIWRRAACLPAKTPITVEMLAPHAAKFQPAAKVIYRTGWDRTFGTPECFSDFPTLTLEAARWIAAAADRPAGHGHADAQHRVERSPLMLLAKGVEIVIVEGLTNLDKLPERFTLAAFPLNIKGRDGSPIRAVAIVD